MKIIICGGRDYNDYDQVVADLKALPKQDITLITGMARGADSIALDIAKEYKVTLEKYPADWNEHGKAAEFIRNIQMLEEGKPDLVLAYWDGKSKGTAHTISETKKRNIPIEITEYVKWLSPEELKANPTKLYLFGDNLISKGKAGQACIRDCVNAYGIPTKRLPSMNSNAFFSDQPDELEAVKQACNGLVSLRGLKIVMPADGLGSGLARMKQYSPKAHELMYSLLSNINNKSS